MSKARYPHCSNTAPALSCDIGETLIPVCAGPGERERHWQDQRQSQVCFVPRDSPAPYSLYSEQKQHPLVSLAQSVCASHEQAWSKHLNHHCPTPPHGLDTTQELIAQEHTHLAHWYFNSYHLTSFQSARVWIRVLVYVGICLCVWVYVGMCLCMCVYCTYMYCMCIHVCIYVWGEYLYVYMHMYACAYTCMYIVCLCVCLYTCVYMYICVCVLFVNLWGSVGEVYVCMCVVIASGRQRRTLVWSLLVYLSWERVAQWICFKRNCWPDSS